jgi:hypothetical protein
MASRVQAISSVLRLRLLDENKAAFFRGSRLPGKKFQQRRVKRTRNAAHRALTAAPGRKLMAKFMAGQDHSPGRVRKIKTLRVLAREF